MDAILVCPWIDIRRPIEIGDLTLLPLPQAVECIDPSLRRSVVLATSYFYRRASVEATVRKLREFSAALNDGDDPARALAEHELTLPQPTSPAVILLTSEFDEERAYRAIDALMFATIVRNNSVAYASAAAFRCYTQRLTTGEAGFITAVSRRAHGSLSNAFYAGDRLELQPDNAGTFHRNAEPALLTALFTALTSPEGIYLIDAVDALRLASSDSPDMSSALEYSLYAKASSLAFYIRGKDDFAVQVVRLEKLLEPFLGPKPTAVGSDATYEIVRVWKAVRSARNSFWHPRLGNSGTYRFERQRLIAPHHIARHMVYAIVVARLIELGALASENVVAADVVGVESWLATIGPELEDGLVDPAGVEGRARAVAQVDWNEASSAASNVGIVLIDHRGRHRMRRALQQAAVRNGD